MKNNTIIKKINILIILILTMFGLNCKNSISNTSINCENFNDFVIKFVTDEKFQYSRTKFPIKFIKWKDNDIGVIDTTIITVDNWKKETLGINTEYIHQTYDNFDRKLQDSNERVFSIQGIENGIGIYFFFKRLDCKWFFVMKEDLST